MSDENASGRGGYNTWWFIAAGVVFLIIVALVAIIIVGRGRGNNNPGAAPAPTSSNSTGVGTQPSTGDGGIGGACDLPVQNQNIPVTAPATTWKTNQYLRFPTSGTYGPVKKAGTDQWGCFQHSPTGALFAAANFVSQVASPQHAAAIKEGAVDDSSRADLLNQDPSYFQQSATDTAQFLGYQFLQEKQDSAVVSLWLGEANVNAAIKVSLVWDASADNWQVELATSDLDGSSITNTTAYTHWSAAGE